MWPTWRNSRRVTAPDERYPLCGIIHCAGVLDDGVLHQQNWARFAKVLAPKVQGAWNLHLLTQGMALDFFVLFSSAAGCWAVEVRPTMRRRMPFWMHSPTIGTRRGCRR